ncbi:hypothetical protein Terro_3069 [Terriglobus roseus DSM 18391]|uniref:Uncharacterized protein n=1 Tax=Terriglobus roseus (strain DSM 18391 / NRRL B-41598 / KBS 63) TaxID=926566 RepID=I3ZJ83_TERRK|nr:hypothetical protein Terro_3069 [Terriglobus roseus DSM 18391]
MKTALLYALIPVATSFFAALVAILWKGSDRAFKAVCSIWLAAWSLRRSR